MDIFLNGERHKCPSCYEELKTGTYQRIVKEWDYEKPQEERDYLHLFGILTGSDFTKISDSSEVQVTLRNAIGWFVDTAFKPWDKPQYLELFELPIQIPEQVGSLSIGQNIALKQHLASCKFIEEAISMAIAIYLQPIIDGKKFSLKRAKAIEPEIRELPIYRTHAIGFFLLSSVMKTGSGTKSLWQRILRSLTFSSAKVWRMSLKSAAYRLTLIWILLIGTPLDSGLIPIGCIGKIHSSPSPSS